MITNAELQTTEAGKNIVIDFYSDTITFIGEALAGSPQGEAVWRIKKIDQTSGMSVTWAGGTSLFDKIWSSRLFYDYL